MTANRRLATLVLVLTLTTCRETEGPVAPSSQPQSPVRGAGADLTIASEPVVLVGAGDIASCSAVNDEATAKLLDGTPGTVFTLGDNAYNKGSASDYANCYGPTWGRHKARTFPAPGDRDYKTHGAQGYFGYFGAAAGDPSKGYYSYDLGDWHIVVLNSSVATSAGSPQEQWLKADLAASSKQCTLAYWHAPRFFSNGSSGVNLSVKPLWDDLFAAGAELVVNAHYRFYERFAPQNADGVADAYGIREFIAGTGGAGTTPFGTIRPNSEIRNSGTAGVLKLTLHAGNYSWEFIPAAGMTFMDAGSGSCHGTAPPVAKPGGPYSSEATVNFDGSASYDPQGDTPLSYSWAFGDGGTGSGAKPSHTYAADGVYTVTLIVTDATGSASDPATTTATIANQPPTVDAGQDQSTAPGDPVTVTVRFTDPGANDAPWSYTIAWGDGSPDDAGTAMTQADPITGTHSYAEGGDYRVVATVTDKDGGAGSDELTVHVSVPGSTVVMLGAGDIADGDSNNRDELTAQLLDTLDGTVFTFGDNAYPNGSLADYLNFYEPTWGRHKARTYASLGNHEYYLGNADGSFDYFGDRAGPRGKGYYSIDLGEWHIIVLNDNSAYVPFAAGSAQDVWLQSDLATNTKHCTIAIWHGPYFRSSRDGTTRTSSRKILWDRLYAAGAELVFNGHHHQYERFTPQTPDGVVDLARGIREIIVGTGGESSALPTTIAPNSEVRAATFGVIKLTLHPGSYEWEFVHTTGQTFTDSGSATCH